LGGAGTILGALGVKSLLSGGASKISGALKGAFGKIGGIKGVLGKAGLSGMTYMGLEQGQKYLNKADVPDEVRYIANLLYDAGQGGLSGLATGNPYAGLVGVAAGTTGAVVNPYGGKGGPSGNAFGGSFGASQSQAALSSPVSGGLTSASYGDKGKIWNGGKHTGNDYPCPIGTDVRATMDGVVYNDNPTSEYGKTVQIDHGNGYQTLFGHLSKVLVSNGQQVKKGDVIGKSGDTGNVDGPHVHYEVRKGKNNPVNPDQLNSGTDGGFSAVNALTSASLTSSISGAEGNSIALSKLLGSGTTSSLAQAGGILGGVSGASSAYGGGGGGGSGNSKVILGTGSEREWATGLLGKLGAPVSEASINALTTWMRHEGGHWKNSANYNPLNTTYSMAGSTSMNPVGVKSYKSWEDGYAATVNTLTGKSADDRGYSAIVSALKSGASTDAILDAVNKSAWMTGKTGGSPYKFQGGSTGMSVASPSMSYSGGGATVTINATFNNATENEARQLIQLVKKELENASSISTMGRN
jgi:hypothetical protein